eukprot:GILI01015613.1.p1 GENE.GILI01015613.1~~GILI01015613.1.p1  ORF type:complete len:191 (+),score=41.93 GILI01015613.1:654-1226(+)
MTEEEADEFISYFQHPTSSPSNVSLPPTQHPASTLSASSLGVSLDNILPESAGAGVRTRSGRRTLNTSQNEDGEQEGDGQDDEHAGEEQSEETEATKQSKKNPSTSRQSKKRNSRPRNKRGQNRRTSAPEDEEEEEWEEWPVEEMAVEERRSGDRGTSGGVECGFCGALCADFEDLQMHAFTSCSALATL